MSRFSPYDWNGGAVVAVAGANFVVLAADTRLSTGYNIKTRNVSRVLRLGQKTALACGGCHADVQGLYNTLTHRATMYRHDNGVEMGVSAAAQLLSNTLYYRRFFPIYALSVIAGIDEQGVGYVAGYDAVGSYLRSKEGYSANGSGASIIMPILDNVIGTGNAGYSAGPRPPRDYTAQEVVEIVKSTFVTAGEREITIGDSIEILVLHADGRAEESTFALKLD